MAPINMINVSRQGSLPAALYLQSGALAKRKADEATSIDDINSSAKRQKMACDLRTPQKPAETPMAAGFFRYRRSAPRTPAKSAVTNNAVPLQAQATVPISASSAVSNSSIAPPSNTEESSAHSAQTASQVKASKAPLPPPTYNPGACFIRALPAPITWAFTSPAPTFRLTHSLTACPIDWTRVPGLKSEYIEAYELREPWNPAPMTFRAVAELTRFPNDKGEQPVEEAVRKRFKKANIAIFKRTGVYFHGSAQGLEAYGVNKFKNPKKETGSRATQTQPRTFRRAYGYEEMAVYEGEVVAVQLQASSDRHPAVRICDKKLIPAYEELIRYGETLKEDDEPYVEALAPFLPFSAEAFDHWHSSVCLGRAQEFPKRTCVCKEVDYGQYMLRVNSKVHGVSAGLMLETYVVSQAMGTSKTSNMILDEITTRLKGVPQSALTRKYASVLQYLPSEDPVYDVINGVQRKHAGSSSGSEYSAQDGDEHL